MILTTIITLITLITFTLITLITLTPNPYYTPHVSECSCVCVCVCVCVQVTFHVKSFQLSAEYIQYARPPFDLPLKCSCRPHSPRRTLLVHGRDTRHMNATCVQAALSSSLPSVSQDVVKNF